MYVFLDIMASDSSSPDESCEENCGQVSRRGHSQNRDSKHQCAVDNKLSEKVGSDSEYAESVCSSTSLDSKSPKASDVPQNQTSDVVDGLEINNNLTNGVGQHDTNVTVPEQPTYPSDVSYSDGVSGKEQISEQKRKETKDSTKGEGKEEEQSGKGEEHNDDREEGECDPDKEEPEEAATESLEEGEIIDEQTDPQPVCRFYARGLCSWGTSCRFLHANVGSKQRYSMFNVGHQVSPVNSGLFYQPPYGKVFVDRQFSGSRIMDPTSLESAWERGLRRAKDMIKKSRRRKETEVDCDEKKTNLGFHHEVQEKGSSCCSNPGNSVVGRESDRPRSRESEKYARRDRRKANEFPKELTDSYSCQYSQNMTKYSWCTDYTHQTARALQTKERRGSPNSTHRRKNERNDKPERTKSSANTRTEETAQRSDGTRHVPAPRHGIRPDDWADPWMRSKSPSFRKEASPSPRHDSSSSKSRSSSSSSYTSSSSCSNISWSKKSNLPRTRSLSPSGTGTARAQHRVLVPTARSNADGCPATLNAVSNKQTEVPQMHSSGVPPQSENKTGERPLLINPPAPLQSSSTQKRLSTRTKAEASEHCSVRRATSRCQVKRKKTAKSKSKRTKPSRQHREWSESSSNSETSGSSSYSSESSDSSSSRSPTPPLKHTAVRSPKHGAYEKFAQSLKVKAMDALKLSGQKQQIKLTLKKRNSEQLASDAQHSKYPPELSEMNLLLRESSGAVAGSGRKRIAEQSVYVELDGLGRHQMAKKAISRREQLLKQLKAVEDAIARKRCRV